MSFRIDKHKAPGHEFRKLLREQVGKAIRALNDPSPASRSKAIHTARIRLKKVRAALRLLQAAAPHEITKTDHGVLRDAARETGEIRDANVNLQTMKKLCDRFGVDRLRFGRTFELLELLKGMTGAEAAMSMHKAATLLKAMQSRIDAWGNHAVAWGEIEQGMKHLYKRGRTAFHEASENVSDESLHTLRKRTKDILFNLKLVQDARPGAARKLAQCAKKLAAILGEERDLTLLQELLTRQGPVKERATIAKLIVERRRSLQEKALKLGSEFYGPKPKEFAGKVIG
jgi:CHAD domain-containing protein